MTPQLFGLLKAFKVWKPKINLIINLNPVKTKTVLKDPPAAAILKLALVDVAAVLLVGFKFESLKSIKLSI